MKAILKHWILTLLLNVLVVSGWAQTFKVRCSSGQQLAYTKINGTQNVEVSCADTNLTGDLIIPDTVRYENITYRITRIGSFERCKLTSVVFPSTSNLYVGLFKNNKRLKSITIPRNVVQISWGAFNECDSLTTLYYYADSCNVIYYQKDRYHCSIFRSLQNVYIGENVKYLPPYFLAYNTQITSLKIPDNVIAIGDYAFSGMNLKTIQLPSHIKKISVGMFYASLITDTISIPNTIEIIEDSAFMHCKNAKSIEIPESVVSIGKGAFYDCAKVESIKSYNPTPPTIADTSTFYNVYKLLPLYIPSGSENAYKYAYGWRDFINREELHDTYEIKVVSADSSKGITWGSGKYRDSSQVTITASANQGYKFVQWQDGNTQANRVITVTSDSTFTAYFQAGQGEEYTIIARSIDNAMGVVYGGGFYSKNATTTLMAAPNTGYEFVQWQDGNKNDVRTITVTSDSTFTAYFRASTSVEEADMQDINVYAADNIIVVQGAENEKVSVYDITGRMLYSTMCAGTEYKVNVSASGIYIVRIGNKCVKKVVVINRM